LVSPLLILFISEPRQDTSHHSRNPAGQTRLTHDREGQLPAGAKGGGAPPHQLSTKAELRAQGIQALAQVTTPIIKLPMKIRRQCGRCGDFNSVLVQPGQAVPAFKCSACGYPAG